MRFDKMDVSTIWQNGEYKGWEDTMMYALTHGLHYGMGAFEGVHAYNTDYDPAIFRWGGHLEWPHQSTRPYGMEIPYTREEPTEMMLEVIRRNDLDSGCAHLVTLYGYDLLGVNPRDNPTKVVIVAWPWGTYLGEDALENSVDVMVSSWCKHTLSRIPMNAETAGLYVNSMLVGEEACRNGYVEAIVLSKEGSVAEGPGENIFTARDGEIHVPGLSQSTLDGIARDAVITPARERGCEADDNATISHDELNTADELFFTGSTAKVTPIRKVDNVVIGKDARGPVTEELQFVFFGLVECRTDDREEWFIYVDE